MSLQTEEKAEKTHNITREKTTSSGSESDDNSSTASEDNAPSPRRLNQKRTPPGNPAVQLQKSTRNRQWQSCPDQRNKRHKRSNKNNPI